MKLIRPAPYSPLTLAFGATSAPYSPSRPHGGEDWGWSESNYDASIRIISAAPGRVRAVQNGFGVGETQNRGWGNRLEVDVTSRVMIAYNHLRSNSFLVQQNQMIDAGIQVATMGNTGWTGGAVHLHFEVWLDGDRVDPAPYYNRDLPGTPLVTPQPEDDMYDQNARNELFAELRKLSNDIKRFSAPLKLYTYGTGIVAINPQTGKFMILAQGYPELLEYLGYAGGGAPKINDDQLKYATQHVGNAVGIPSLKLSGLSARSIQHIEKVIDEDRITVSQEQYDQLVADVTSAARDGGVEGVEKALEARTAVLTALAED